MVSLVRESSIVGRGIEISDRVAKVVAKLSRAEPSEESRRTRKASREDVDDGGAMQQRRQHRQQEGEHRLHRRQQQQLQLVPVHDGRETR